MRYAKYLPTLGAKIDIAAPEKTPELLKPHLIDRLRAMRAQWRYVVFLLELNHSTVSILGAR